MGDKKLNIAVVLSSDLESGGGFQYEFMVLKILKDYHTNEEFDFNYYTIILTISPPSTSSNTSCVFSTFSFNVIFF